MGLLTDEEVLDALLMLDLPVRTDVTFALVGEGAADKLRQAEVARIALDKVNDAQAAKVRSLLAQFAEVETDTDIINAEGLDSDANRQRARLRAILRNAIGMPVSAGGLRIRRG